MTFTIWISTIFEALSVKQATGVVFGSELSAGALFYEGKEKDDVYEREKGRLGGLKK